MRLQDNKIVRTFWFLVEIYQAMNARNIGLLAAGVAFFALLALFPGIAAFISVFGFFADPLMLQDQLTLVEELLPPAAFTLLSNQITRLVWANDGILGWTSLLSIFIALFLARRGVDAMLIGICAIHDTPRRSGFSHAIRVAIITIGMLVVGVVALLAVLILPVLLAFIPIDGAQSYMIDAGRWALAMGLVALWITVFYWIGPNRTSKAAQIWKPGLVLALVLWISVSAGFSYYLGNFGNYNEIYGSIGAVIALLMWFYISAYAVLLGGILNATLEKRQEANGSLNSLEHSGKSDGTSPQVTE